MDCGEADRRPSTNPPNLPSDPQDLQNIHEFNKSAFGP